MNRSRNFEFIIYEEHWKNHDDLYQKLDDLQVNYYLSPLHDKDYYKTGDIVKLQKSGFEKCIFRFLSDFKFHYIYRRKIEVGDVKKSHWHLLVFFGGVKSFEQCREFGKEVCSTRFDVVRDKTGALRYLCHLDSKDKHVYDTKDVRCRNSDYEKLIQENHGSSAILDVIKIIRENEIVDFSDLIYWCVDNGKADLLDIISLRSYFFVSLLKGKRLDKKSKTAVSYDSTPSGAGLARLALGEVKEKEKEDVEIF